MQELAQLNVCKRTLHAVLLHLEEVGRDLDEVKEMSVDDFSKLLLFYIDHPKMYMTKS